MEEDKRIEERLLGMGIKQYKIVRTIIKGLQYREYFGKEFIEDIYEDNLLVLLKTIRGVARFTISACQSVYIIDTAIESCIKNTGIMSMQWHDDDFSSMIIENDENCNCFHNFNRNEYLMWIKQEMNTVSQAVNFKLNTVCKVKLYKYSLLTNKEYLEQYNTSSEFLCIENETYKRKAMIDNLFFNNDIAKLIIKQLNEVDIPLKKIRIEKNQRILIKAKALSSLLNTYVCLYYADRVYSKQSYIRTNYIGKEIVKNPFDLNAIPYNGIVFDGEGSRIYEKLIIDSGKLNNLLSNNSNSEYLGLTSYGNASLEMVDSVSHQRLIITLKNPEKVALQSLSLTIYQFENIYIDFADNEFRGIAICGDKFDYYRTTISLNVEDVFNNIYPTGTKNTWIKNVYCQDVIFKIKSHNLRQ
ncbi:MAG: metallopeptidase TldD-related protein [Anaerocolumna sp.]